MVVTLSLRNHQSDVHDCSYSVLYNVQKSEMDLIALHLGLKFQKKNLGSGIIRILVIYMPRPTSFALEKAWASHELSYYLCHLFARQVLCFEIIASWFSLAIKQSISYLINFLKPVQTGCLCNSVQQTLQSQCKISLSGGTSWVIENGEMERQKTIVSDKSMKGRMIVI